MDKIKNIVIAGGGTAGWISAAAMAKLLGDTVNITLVESEAIGTVGVGEATIPQIIRLNQILGLDQAEFIRETKATFKLGIEFSNWGKQGEHYLHTFGDPGINLAALPFHQYWLRATLDGLIETNFWDFSLHNSAAYNYKFAYMHKVGQTNMGGLAYAFHFDAGLYAKFLRKYAEDKGVTRIEGRINRVEQEDESGNITSLKLENGQTISGDLFVDCTGFRSLLLGQALGVKFHDWSHYLPCNSAVTVGCERSEPLLPYTKSIAHKAGWQWRIPLQHRTGNGHVFCDRHVSVDEATQTLLDNLDAPAIGEPRALKFTTGRRDQLWVNNVVAVGLASGFLEPLESTSIHFIQSNIGKLIENFPHRGITENLRKEYNRQVVAEFDKVRDFLVLHYKLNQRDDSPFWKDCAAMDVPKSLTEKMALFEAGGRIFHDPEDLFRVASWVQVMLGQNLMPKDYHPMAGRISDEELTEFLGNVKSICEQASATLPSHGEFVAQLVKG